MRRAKYTVFLAASLLALGLETQAMAREVIFTGEDCPLTVITDLTAYLNRPKTEKQQVVFKTVAAQTSGGQTAGDLSEAYAGEPEEGDEGQSSGQSASDLSSEEQVMPEQTQSEQAAPEQEAAVQPADADEEQSGGTADDQAQPEETAGDQTQPEETAAGQTQTDEEVIDQAQPDETAIDQAQPDDEAVSQAQPGETAADQVQTPVSEETEPVTEADTFKPQTFESDGVLMTLPSEEVTLSSFDALGIIDDTYVMITYGGGKTGYLSTDEIDVKVPDMNGRLMRELPSVSNWTTLKQGSDGDLVSQAQQVLEDLQLLEGGVDGLYGSGTAASVQRFQESAGLPATGEIDAVTWLRITRAGDSSLRSVKPLETVYPPVYEAQKKFYMIYNYVVDPEYLNQFLDPEWKIKYNVFDGAGRIDYTRDGISLGRLETGNREIDKIKLDAGMYLNLKRSDAGLISPLPVIEIKAQGTHLPYIKGATLKYGIYSENLPLTQRDASLSGMNSVETALLEITWDAYRMVKVELGGGDLILQVHGEERDFDMDLTPYLHQVMAFTDTCFNIDSQGPVEEEEEEEEEDFYTEEEPTSETEMAEPEFAIATPDVVTEEADASAVFNNTTTTEETSEIAADTADDAGSGDEAETEAAAPAAGAFPEEEPGNEPEQTSEAEETAPEDNWTSQEADEASAVEPETAPAVEEPAAEEAGSAE